MVVASARTSATVTPVAVTSAATVLFQVNADAVQRTVENGTGHTLFLKYGAGAAQADRTVSVPAGMVYEFPCAAVFVSGEVVPIVYAGLVTGALESGNGTVFVTEV